MYRFQKLFFSFQKQLIFGWSLGYRMKQNIKIFGIIRGIPYKRDLIYQKLIKIQIKVQQHFLINVP